MTLVANKCRWEDKWFWETMSVGANTLATAVTLALTAKWQSCEHEGEVTPRYMYYRNEVLQVLQRK